MNNIKKYGMKESRGAVKKGIGNKRNRDEDKRYEKRIELNDRDRLILKLLWKFRVMSIDSVRVLGEFSSNRYASARMKKLSDYGYVKMEQFSISEKGAYSLTVKGNEVLGLQTKPYRINRGTLEHELGISLIASWLKINRNYDPLEFITDRERRQDELYTLSTKTDLYYPKDNLIIEYERTQKSINRITEKVSDLYLISSNQLWIIPKARKKLKESLSMKLNDYSINHEIINFDLIEREVVQ